MTTEPLNANTSSDQVEYTVSYYHPANLKIDCDWRPYLVIESQNNNFEGLKKSNNKKEPDESGSIPGGN